MTDNRDIVVLVADDEPSMLALVSAYLKSKGYKVIEASDGDRAWQLAHEHLPDLVILDVMMPAMSGWEVCRKIREALPLAHTGVIMLTGIGENLNEMTSPLYGADAHIDKPFEFADLEERMKETLAKRRSEHTMGRPDGADEETEAGEDEETPESMPPSAEELEEVADSEPRSARKAKAAPVLAVNKARKKASKKKTARQPDSAPPVALGRPSKKASKKAAAKGKKKASKKPSKKATARKQAKSAVRSKAPGPSSKPGKKAKKTSANKAAKKALRGKPPAAKKKKSAARSAAKASGARARTPGKKKKKKSRK